MCRAYDEREFEDISESGSRLSKDTKIERFSTNEQDIEVGSVEEPDVQIFRTRGLQKRMYIFTCKTFKKFLSILSSL